jgi:hypothetical protein
MTARRTFVLRLWLLGLALVATASVAADPRPYMKRAKPNELPLLVETYGCPVDAVTVRAMAEGVMTRAQVKPLDPTKIEVPLPPPWLYVNVTCLDGGAAFRTDVDFVSQQGADLVRLSLSGYGGLGMAEDKDAAYVLDGIKERVEAAVTDYVKANSESTVAPEPSRRSNRTR